MAELNQLVNEYYADRKTGPVKLPYLQQQIWELVKRTNLKADLDLKTMLTRERGDHTHEWDDALTPEGIPATLASMNGNEVAHLIEDLDGYLCELGMAQIRDGLHILGQMPPLPEMLRSLTRLANARHSSLQASLATAFGFDLSLLLDNPVNALDRTATSPRIRLAIPSADVLETLDRAALDIFTMLETLGFRPRSIAEVQRAVLGLESEGHHKVLSFCLHGTCVRSSNRQEMRSSICSTHWKESMCRPVRLAHRRAVWPIFCLPAEISMRSIRERCLRKQHGA